MSNPDETDPCLSDAILAGYTSGLMSGLDIAGCEAHLQNCEVCQRTVAELFNAGSQPDWLAALPPASLARIADFPAEGGGGTPAAAHQLWRGQREQPSDATGTGAYTINRMSAEPASRTMPELLGRYRVGRLLGSGGFGRVFLAVDEKLKRNVAIKVPHSNFTQDHAHLELMLAEAQIAAGLDHPGIAPIYDVGSTDQLPMFLVSKLIEGQTLAEQMQRESYTPEAAAGLIAQVAEALDYAHQSGIVHRDIKPQNILLDENGHAVLVDFGLAWRSLDGTQAYPQAGTPAYMSPEQHGQSLDPIDHRADIYSLGKVLIELLAGPMGSPSQYSVSQLSRSTLNDLRALSDTPSQVSEPVPSPPSKTGTTVDRNPLVNPRDANIPPALAAICRRATATRVEDRFATAGEMARQLRNFLGIDGTEPLPKRTWQRKHTLAIGLALLLLTVIGVGWQVYRSQQLAAQAVADLLASDDRDLTSRLQQIGQYGTQTHAALKSALNSPDKNQQLRAQLALLPSNEELLWEVTETMLSGDARTADLLAIQLKPYLPKLSKRMWALVKDENTQAYERVLNAAVFLAHCCPEDSHWSSESTLLNLSRALLQDDLTNLSTRLESFQNVKDKLVIGLRSLTRMPHLLPSSEHVLRIFNVWDILVQDDVDQTVDLMVNAPPMMYTTILGRMQADEATIRSLQKYSESGGPDDEKIPPKTRRHQRHLAAMALLALGHDDSYWSFWRHSPTPDNIVSQLSLVGYAPLTRAAILKRLRSSQALTPVKHLPDSLKDRLFDATLSQRRYLLMALSRANPHELPDAERTELIEEMSALCSQDADPGMRAAAERMLAYLQATPAQRLGPRSDAPDGQIRSQAWSVNSLDEVMIEIPASETVPYRYALAGCEVQRQHFEQFLKETQHAWQGHKLSQDAAAQEVDGHCAQIQLSWYDAAAFCNWLSRKEGLDECYQPNEQGLFAAGMRIKPNILKLSGYRMPTGAEWETGCRAGATTLCSFGESTFMSNYYAWDSQYSDNHTQPVGSLLPNSLGLFDAHGNASEWTMDVESSETPMNWIGVVEDHQSRIHRGGGFNAIRQTAMSSVVRNPTPPHERLEHVGLRLARSLD
ncbi:MAG: SUMF1/EgtB/PvdO family nonheme iron enzyme [Pirellulaceae bacterium]|nr:SUMF1/EgtB/PvdO family nonheme iron enzyme [Pirellulaceae bacterium]